MYVKSEVTIRPFLASLLRTCSHERLENLVHGFFQKLKFKENVFEAAFVRIFVDLHSCHSILQNGQSLGMSAPYRWT